MFSTISYIAPDGVETITFNDGNGYLINSGGLKGLSGSSDDIAVELPWGGQRFVNIKNNPMECTLSIIVEGNGAEEETQQRVKRLRSMFSRMVSGSLTLDNGDGITYTLDIRQAGAIEVPEIETTLDDIIIVDIPIISDNGYWRTSTTAASMPDGNVTINGVPTQVRRFTFTNTSELPTSGKVVWHGDTEGAIVAIYDQDTGAVIGSTTLPPAGDTTLAMNLSPRSALMITDAAGEQQLEKWRAVKGTMFPVGVNPGERQVIVTNHPNARVFYDVKILDPWEW